MPAHHPHRYRRHRSEKSQRGLLGPTLNPHFCVLQCPNPKSPKRPHFFPVAAMAALQLRPKYRALHHPSLIHLFSTSRNPPDPTPSTSPDPDEKSETQSEVQSVFASYFSDVRASLKKQPEQGHRRPSTPYPRRRQFKDPSLSTPSRVASLEEIRKNLSEFRLRSSGPPSTESDTGSSTSFSSSSSQSSQHISFQDLYKRNVIEKAEENNNNAESGRGNVGDGGGKLSFESIRESLRQLRVSSRPGTAPNERRGTDPTPLSEFKNIFRFGPSTESRPVIGGTDPMFVSALEKDRERKEAVGHSTAMKSDFAKMYTYEQLGEKMRMLRPVGKDGEAGFSLGELNVRLIKLRELEDKESSKTNGVSFKDLRESLLNLKVAENERAKKKSMQRLDILGQLGKAPNFMQQPPKEHLVEKYFHPDNMSSGEKLKIELAKVRDEFKMSDSDCGSARVQVAQLTTKIKHLSSVLHKKDKHSRKGLIGMVQRRKRLLKYLRRTDWDSYSFVLSKLGLRDNPNYKI